MQVQTVTVRLVQYKTKPIQSLFIRLTVKPDRYWRLDANTETDICYLKQNLITIYISIDCNVFNVIKCNNISCCLLTYTMIRIYQPRSFGS